MTQLAKLFIDSNTDEVIVELHSIARKRTRTDTSKLPGIKHKLYISIVTLLSRYSFDCMRLFLQRLFNV